jgi:histidinol-phosphatase (PHP family)
LYLIDYHVHTKRCGHACGEDRWYVESAIQKGLKEIGFSDHIPRFYESPNGKVTERGMPQPELENYVASITALKSEYKEISVKLGLEVDFVPGWEREIEKIALLYPWDYLTGSVHFIPEWNYGYIGSDKEHTPAEIYTAYFSKVAEAAASKLFDILGHIDLPRRFFARLAESEMQDLYQSLAVRLGKTDAVIELNTYGVRSAKHDNVGILPELDLLRSCRHHGVKVTLGSDAHKPEEVGADYDRIVALLTRVGYDRIVVFQNRKAAMVKWREEHLI